MGDRGLPDIDAELEELTVDARGAPKRVRDAHVSDELPDLTRRSRSSTARSRFPSPIGSETGAVPADHCAGRITVSASSVVGTSRDSKTNNRRSKLLNAGLFGDLRLSTLIWWRRTRISASRRALERNNPMSAPQSNLSS
jgi:hypothetical protein